MKSRPWPIVILALLNILSPIYNVAISAHYSGGTIPVYLKTLFAQSHWYEIALFFLAQPIAGFSIFWMQVWSYPLFILMTALTALFNFMGWKQNPEIFSLNLLAGSFVVNVALVSYFLIPQVRLVYFNRRIRWWEAKPRFIIDIPARVVVSPEDKRAAVIHNISEGGAFLEVSGRLSAKRSVRLEFVFMGRAYDFEAKVVHRRRAAKGGGYGFQFIHDADTLEFAQRFARALDLLGCASNRNPVPLKESFVSWITTLATTGRGWVPEVDSAQGPRRPGQG